MFQVRLKKNGPTLRESGESLHKKEQALSKKREKAIPVKAAESGFHLIVRVAQPENRVTPRPKQGVSKGFGLHADRLRTVTCHAPAPRCGIASPHAPCKGAAALQRLHKGHPLRHAAPCTAPLLVRTRLLH